MLKKKLKEILVQNELLDYIYLCLKHMTSQSKRKEVCDFHRAYDFLRVEKLGELNKDKVIYMIDPANSYTSGFFSNMRNYLMKMDFAERYDLCAVVYKGQETHYAEKNHYLGTDNYFEYFFEQPYGISEQEARQSSHVIWSKSQHISVYSSLTENQENDILTDSVRRHLIFKKEIKSELEEARRTFVGNHKILGVKYRGTGYRYPHKDHPVFVSEEEMIERVKKMYEMGFDKIYLATEDKASLKLFKDFFGSDLLYDESIKRSDQGQLHIDLALSNPDMHSAFREGLNVLKDVWVLAHTDSFVGAYCGVTRFVPIFNRAYDAVPFRKVEIIDKGRYKHGVNSIKEGEKMYGVKRGIRGGARE